MVAVLGISALLTVVTIAGFTLARQSLQEAEITKYESYAFQAANGGINAAVARTSSGGFPTTFPAVWTGTDLGGVEATVTITTPGAGEYLFTSVGRAPDGTLETVRARMFFMDLYGMNIAYGSGFRASGGGKFNGNASIYGPFYTHGSLVQGDNLGNSMAGGFGWGPIYISGGTLDVKDGYLVDVGFVYVDPTQPDPRGIVSPTRLIRQVPRLEVPRVDAAFLSAAYEDARSESSDNIQGDPDVRTTASTEVTAVGNPATYRSTRWLGAPANSPYKIVDNNGVMDRSFVGGLTILDATPSFGLASLGLPSNDFAWDTITNTLTVWGTVFIDGPFTVSPQITYTGNGSIVVNGDIRINGFVPQDGLRRGEVQGLPSYGLPHQSFDPAEVVGLVTPDRIFLTTSSGGNPKNPDGAPTHAGAFFADTSITFQARSMVVGSIISQGIEVSGNNNMDLRTSANLGATVPRSMPGVGITTDTLALWARE